MSEKMVLTVEEAGKMLGVSRPTAYQLSRSKGFPTIRIGRRVLVPVEQLKEWIAAQTKEAQMQ